jgi:hypothetical protein
LGFAKFNPTYDSMSLAVVLSINQRRFSLATALLNIVGMLGILGRGYIKSVQSIEESQSRKVLHTP